jgi:hypothetical protein
MSGYPSILVDEERDAPGAMAAAAAAANGRNNNNGAAASSYLPPVAGVPSRLPAQMAPAPSPAAAPVGSGSGAAAAAAAVAARALGGGNGAGASSASGYSPVTTPRRRGAGADAFARQKSGAFADGLPLPPPHSAPSPAAAATNNNNGNGPFAGAPLAPPPATAAAHHYPPVATSGIMGTVPPHQPQQQQQQQQAYNPMQPYRTSAGGVPPAPSGPSAPSPFAAAAQALACQQRAIWRPRVPPRPLERALSWSGLLLVLAYLAATAYYLYVRGTVSLQMGRQTPYGALVFAVELLGLASVLPYAAMLVVYTRPARGSRGLPADDGRVALPLDKRFHVRVLVPCYKEPLAVVRNTVNAALGAHLPPGVQRTVYLCDDGGDPDKAALMAKLGPQGGR